VQEISVCVGSKNPSKIEATKRAFKRIFGERVRVYSIKVNSGVSVQPLSDEEMVKGAINRAKKAFNAFSVDFGIGLEGGVVKYSFGVFVKGWAAVYNGLRVSIASSVALPLPEYIWGLLISGKARELEEIMERLSGIRNIGDSIGAIGFLTQGKYDRIRAFEDAIICAMAPFLVPSIFKEEFLSNET